MKTIILYATKHGAAGEIAGRIAAKMNGAVTCDLSAGDPPPLAGFDCVILGSAVYVGQIRKEAKDFLANHEAELLGKKLGLFVSGLQPEAAAAALESNFSPELRRAAKSVCFLGGVFDPKKAGFLERMTMKTVAKLTEYTDRIDDNGIRELVEAIGS